MTRTEIDYTVQIWQEGEHFVAHAMPLDVATSAGDAQAARTALDEAVTLFVRTAADQGVLDQVLEEAGYERDESGWHSPRWVCFERHSTVVAA